MSKPTTKSINIYLENGEMVTLTYPEDCFEATHEALEKAMKHGTPLSVDNYGGELWYENRDEGRYLLYLNGKKIVGYNV